MSFCRNCGKELDQSVCYCPTCGAQQAEDRKTGFSYTLSKTSGSYTIPKTSGSYSIPQPNETTSANSQQEPIKAVSESFLTMVSTACDSITNTLNQASANKASSNLNKGESTGTESSNSNSDGQQTGSIESIKCPNCRGMVSSFTAFCPYCGAELQNLAAASACQELCDRLEKIEATRPKETIMSSVITIVNRKADNIQLDPTDKRKIELIGNFVVPNTKSDIMEFLFLAESRIDACKNAMISSNERDKMAQQALLNVWISKYDQVMKKGKIVLAHDPDFQVLAENYQREQNKAAGLCRYCGGSFRGMFKKNCSKCGRPKDY